VQQEWDVFFSHSTRRDRDTRTYRLVEGVYLCLTRSNRRPFWDRKCAMTETTLLKALRGRLDHSRIAVLFINQEFWKRHWVKIEVNYIGQLRDGGRIRVLCVLINPEERLPDWVSLKEVIVVPPEVPISGFVTLICARLNRTLNSAA
jgi:TIR domain